MKKERIISLMLALTATAMTAQADVAIDATNFPDVNFRKIVAGKDIDTNSDGKLSSSEIKAVTSLNVVEEGIEYLNGIEHFTELTQLWCNSNKIHYLILNKNTKLTFLNCSENDMDGLELGSLNSLNYLNCSKNKLKILRVSRYASLENIYCSNNQLYGTGMQDFIDCLTNRNNTNHHLYIADTSDPNEKNVISKEQINVLKETGMKIHAYNGTDWYEYGGAAGFAISESNFPDANFRTFVAGNTIDTNSDGFLSDTEIAAVKEIDIIGKNIKALNGIEFFTELESLKCFGNQLTFLNLSKNTKLTYLHCGATHLTSLNVSKNTALTFLDCSGNQLTSIDVSKNTKLTYLGCSGNQLTSLDVSKNTALTGLNCSENRLTSLDVSKNTALKKLECFVNQIKGEQMQALVNSLCKVNSSGYDFIVLNTKNADEQNEITVSQVAIAKSKGWNVMAWNDTLEEYEGSEPGIAIDATNFPDENFRAIVAGTDIDKDADGKLSEEEIAAVTELIVSQKNIASLKGIEFFTALTDLYCWFNQLTSLDVSKNTALQVLDSSFNQLTSLDVSKNTALKVLDLSSNQLKSLDVSKNTALEEMYCEFNQLASLDVSKNTALTVLSCFNNQIKGDKMQALVNSLPTVTEGVFRVIDTKNSNEQNVCTEPQVKIATDKGWTVYDYNGGSDQEYAGSEVTAIRSIEVSPETKSHWYTLDGKRLSGKPAQKGIYIHNGKKVVIK